MTAPRLLRVSAVAAAACLALSFGTCGGPCGAHSSATRGSDSSSGGGARGTCRGTHKLHRRRPVVSMSTAADNTATAGAAAAAGALRAGAAAAAATAAAAGAAAGAAALAQQDPEVFGIIGDERRRQVAGIELIASENFVSPAVLEALGSVMTNKYSEGLPGARYYGGNEHIDRMERLCQARALATFGLDGDEWGVNVQPYSGSPANFAVYTALLAPHDRIMGLDLPSGGHLTHGYYSAKRKISATSIYFESLPYEVDAATGLLDYDEMERRAQLFRPKLIIAGASAYPRDWDYARMRQIADGVGAVLMADMAHISGLVAAHEAADPFQHCHVVTTTTHKTLRGPRSGMIFMRKEFQSAIDFAVFPSLQGGPHNHQIAALAVALREAQQPAFREYILQVKANARTLAASLQRLGYTIVTGGTDNHLVLWDLRPQKISGSKVEALLESAAITVNKNTIHGDKSAVAPGGVRLGSPAMTTRGLTESHFEHIAELLHRGVCIALDAQAAAGSAKLADFRAALELPEIAPRIATLRAEVQSWSGGFYFPGA